MINRAAFLRFWLRLILRRREHLPIDVLRRRIERLGRLALRLPRGVAFAAMSADGVPGERVTAAVSRADRHVLFLHGGGYTFGSSALYRDFNGRIAIASGATVFSIDYRLAPEHSFPAALDDAMAAYRWLLAEGADPRHIAIAGDSAGGGLALATLMRLRDEGTALPSAAVLIAPWADLAMTGESLKRSAFMDPVVSIEAAVLSARAYLAGIDPRHPFASPLYGDLNGLPPTLIAVGGDELLLDDSLRVAERMRAAGCEVEIDVLPGMFHGWYLFPRLLPDARRTIARIGAFIGGRI